MILCLSTSAQIRVSCDSSHYINLLVVVVVTKHNRVGNRHRLCVCVCVCSYVHSCKIKFVQEHSVVRLSEVWGSISYFLATRYSQMNVEAANDVDPKY